MGYRLGVDTGGTFTDVVLIAPNGDIRIAKVPTTPPEYEKGVISGIRSLGVGFEEVELFIHGFTLATNAVITKTGARCGLVGTKGFRDILQIRRANRPKEGLYNIMWKAEPPLIPRRHRLTVTERVDYLGRVMTSLDEEEARSVARALHRQGIEAVAVCFLNSFLNPANERRMGEILREENPSWFITLSADLAPVIREFERTATTVVNAYVGPIMANYLSALEQECRKIGYRGDVLVMHSSGGVMTASTAASNAAHTVKSGPAAGVVAAAAIGQLVGEENVLSFDMGGTSTDISVIHRGAIRTTEESEIEFGLPLIFPSIDVVTIGAGGGTIAWIDEGGVLKSGPQSAGARPGPACYNLGGREATVTDANLFLGFLSPETFAGGALQLYPELAEQAVGSLATKIGLDPIQTASGILRITNNNMIRALRAATTERGYDPREFTLVAFGGAGPLHCAVVAQELQIPRVIVPVWPGVTSALGLLFSDIRHDFSRTYIRRSDLIEGSAVEEEFQHLESLAHERLAAEGVPPADRKLQRIINFKYYGGFEPVPLSVPVAEGAFSEEALAAAIESFHQTHEKEYGFALRQIPVQMELVRVIAWGFLPSPSLKPREIQGGILTQAQKGSRSVFFAEEGRFVATPIYDRAKLFPGARVRGPAIVEQIDSTTVIRPGMEALVDAYANLVIHTGRSAGG